MRRPPPVAVPDPVDVTSGPLPDPRRVAPRRRSDLGHGTGTDSLLNSKLVGVESFQNSDSEVKPFSKIYIVPFTFNHKNGVASWKCPY